MMDKLLLSAVDTAKLLGISRSLFYSMNSGGQIGPLPVPFGRRILWKRKEIEAWVAADCPARQKWQQIRAEKK